MFGGVFVPFLLKYANVFFWFLLTIFILRQIYLFIGQNKFYLFKLFLFSKWFLLYVLFAPYFNRQFFYYFDAIILFHNIQYIAWVWLYYHKHQKKGAVKERKVFSYLSQTKLVPLYLFLLLLISIIVFFTANMVGHAKMINFALVCIHFFSDARIWSWNIFNKSL